MPLYFALYSVHLLFSNSSYVNINFVEYYVKEKCIGETSTDGKVHVHPFLTIPDYLAGKGHHFVKMINTTNT